MPYFSKKSLDNLNTCDTHIQLILKEAIKIYDFSVIYGHRTIEEQFELFKKGRDSNLIITNQDEVVTYCDGKIKKSDHNFYPSKAVDIVPYPSGYSDKTKFYYLSGVVLTIARFKNINLKWGGNWNFKDLPHFYL